LNVNVRVGVVVVVDPTGTELATFTAYVAAGPVPDRCVPIVADTPASDA